VDCKLGAVAVYVGLASFTNALVWAFLRDSRKWPNGCGIQCLLRLQLGYL